MRGQLAVQTRPGLMHQTLLSKGATSVPRGVQLGKARTVVCPNILLILLAYGTPPLPETRSFSSNSDAQGIVRGSGYITARDLDVDPEELDEPSY